MGVKKRPLSPHRRTAARRRHGPHVEVEVGELVLTGFGRIDAGAVAAAFGTELSRLLEASPAHLAETDVTADGGRWRLPAARLRATARPESIGRTLARAVYAAIGDACEAGATSAAAVWHQPGDAAAGGAGPTVPSPGGGAP